MDEKKEKKNKKNEKNGRGFRLILHVYRLPGYRCKENIGRHKIKPYVSLGKQ